MKERLISLHPSSFRAVGPLLHDVKLLLLAVRVVTGAADFHHVNLGRVLALLAAILAVLRRGATTRRARALVLRLLVRHLNPPPFSTRCGRVFSLDKFRPAKPPRSSRSGHAGKPATR